MDVELVVVPGCPHADETRELLASVLAELGLSATALRTTMIRTDAEALRREFCGSPTILIDGVDPFAQPAHRAALACRLYPGPAGPRGRPDRVALRAALAAFDEGHVTER